MRPSPDRRDCRRGARSSILAAPNLRSVRADHETPADIAVRANQKDVFVVEDLSEQVETVFRNLLGTRWLQAWGSELRVGSKLAYFVLTTFLGAQEGSASSSDARRHSDAGRGVLRHHAVHGERRAAAHGD